MEHAKTAESLFHIAKDNKDNKNDKTLRVMREVLQTQESVLGRDHKDTAHTMIFIAGQLDHIGEKNEALTMLKEAFPIIGNVYGKDSDVAIDIQNTITRISLELEDEKAMGMRIIYLPEDK